jgi:hypothetical protein
MAHDRVLRTVCLRLLTVLGLMLGAPTIGSAQTAAEHAAQAHGDPIEDGKNIQPTPQVVERRLRHYRQMLKAEEDEASGAAAEAPIVGPGTPAKPPDGGLWSQPDGGRWSQQEIDLSDTKQLCHDLLHGGKRPPNAANDPARCE